MSARSLLSALLLCYFYICTVDWYDCASVFYLWLPWYLLYRCLIFSVSDLLRGCCCVILQRVNPKAMQRYFLPFWADEYLSLSTSEPVLIFYLLKWLPSFHTSSGCSLIVCVRSVLLCALNLMWLKRVRWPYVLPSLTILILFPVLVLFEILNFKSVPLVGSALLPFHIWLLQSPSESRNLWLPCDMCSIHWLS